MAHFAGWAGWPDIPNDASLMVVGVAIPAREAREASEASEASGPSRGARFASGPSPGTGFAGGGAARGAREASGPSRFARGAGSARRPRIRPAALVPVARLRRSTALVVVDLDSVPIAHAVMATVSAVALRALMRRGATYLTAPPRGAARVVGTAGIIVYSSGRTVLGRTWVWGDASSAPPVATPVAALFQRGRVAHHYHTTEALGPPCPLCGTTHTGGADVCHRCILAAPQYIPTAGQAPVIPHHPT